jgi:hypothetical protein
VPRRFLAPALPLALVVACGGDSSGNPEAGADAAPDAVALDAPHDVDSGIPPLVCPGESSEPEDSEVLATVHPAIDECDSSGSSWTDVSSGTGDVDWMRYAGNDKVIALCVVDPTVTINTPGLRVCEFMMCLEGATTIVSCTNGQPATSPAGTQGCCTTSTASMTAKISCSGVTSNNSANVFIRVDQPGSNVCLPFQVDYHF